MAENEEVHARARGDVDPSGIAFDAPVASVGGQLIVCLPAPASAQLPSRGQVAVVGEMNGAPLQTVVEPDGRRGHWIKIDARLAAKAKLEEGGVAAVEIAPTKEWPEPSVPGDLRAALDAAPDLDDVWESITPMARWEWVRWVCATRNPATRERRVTVAISKMRSGKRRPCCFDLSACTDPDLAKSGKLISG